LIKKQQGNNSGKGGKNWNQKSRVNQLLDGMDGMLSKYAQALQMQYMIPPPGYMPYPAMPYTPAQAKSAKQIPFSDSDSE
jgi:hypothetical protein